MSSIGSAWRGGWILSWNALCVGVPCRIADGREKKRKGVEDDDDGGEG